MHTVLQTHAFVRAAAEAGMSEDEVDDLVSYIAANPTAGEVIKETGGCRKVRVAGKGKGKSGGYRTITFYSGTELPIFLITVFSKGEKVNLTKRERRQLAQRTKALVEEYRSRVVQVGKRA
jgi:hypothetical protein